MWATHHMWALRREEISVTPAENRTLSPLDQCLITIPVCNINLTGWQNHTGLVEQNSLYSGG